jgi:hypothetical protein
MGWMRNEENSLVGNPKWRSQHGRSRHRWNVNIEMDLNMV